MNFHLRSHIGASLITIALGLLASFAPRAYSQQSSPADDWRNVEPPLQPKVAEASAEAVEAMQGFALPEKWKIELFAAEPEVANPVALDVDSQGRVFVAETFRQTRGVEDNRSHRKWLVDDLRAQTIEDRLAYIKKHLGEKASEYTRHDDRIRLLTDSDGDGRADKSQVFSSGYNTILSGTGAGVLSWRGNVYYTCIPDLWLLRDVNQDGVADDSLIMSSGYGVRFAFRGHDMHGLIVGPDGRLYFSIGDRGYHVQLDGQAYRTGRHTQSLLHDPASGAVFRCELDGSNLEVIHTGLRNPQELAFDDHGNLFTGDNNSDSGDKARWVHVVPGADSGWRMHYQYLPDRGPFNRERIWHPPHASTPPSILPPITNLSDGPSGLCFYPGSGLSEKFKGRFFLCDFRGQKSNSGIRTFRTVRRGAYFDVVDQEQSVWGVLATDVQFGPDGKLYLSDWVHGWNGLDKGRIYTLSDTSADEALIAEVRRLLVAEYDAMSSKELAALLAHADRRIRLRAQFELAARNDWETLQNVLTNAKSESLARVHAVWGLGQILRSETGYDASRAWAPLDKAAKIARSGDIADADLVLEQVYRTIADAFPLHQKTARMRRAEDKASREDLKLQQLLTLTGQKAAATIDEGRNKLASPQLAAAIRLAGATWPVNDPHIDSIIQLFADSSTQPDDVPSGPTSPSADPLVWQESSLALARIAFRCQPPSNKFSRIDDYAAERTQWLEKSMANPAFELNAQTQLLRLMVIRKLMTVFKEEISVELQRDVVCAALDSDDLRLRAAAARLIYDLRLTAGLEPLAQTPLEPVPVNAREVEHDAVFRRSLAAALRIGDRNSLLKILATIADNRLSIANRRIALSTLSKGLEPQQLDPVLGCYWPFEVDRESLANAVSDKLPELLALNAQLLPEVIQLASAAGVSGLEGQLESLVRDTSAADSIRAAALAAWGATVESTDKRAELKSMALEQQPNSLWLAGFQLAVNDQDSGLFQMFERGLAADDIQIRQQVLRLGGKIEDGQVASFFRQRLRESSQSLTEPTMLDLIVGAGKRAEPEIAAALAEFEQKLKSLDSVTDRYAWAIAGGDAANGRRVFFEKTDVSCVRCHQAGAVGGEVGPQLAGIGLRKDRRYLLESIVEPNAQVAEGYESVVIWDMDGVSHSGIIGQRTARSLELLNAEGVSQELILLEEIDEIQKGNSSMPEDLVQKLSRDELRDLIAYLASLTEEPANAPDANPAAGGGHPPGDDDGR